MERRLWISFALLVSFVLGHSVSPFSFLPQNITSHFDGETVLEASPSLLQHKDWVQLRFSGVQNPSDRDWIGVFSPSNVDVSTTAPVKYKHANASKDYLSTGSGVLRFDLINLREDYAFVFFRDNVAVAKSNVVSFANYFEPLIGHLSLTNKSNQMRLTWVSKGKSNARVRFGVVPASYTREILATTTTYTRDQMCGDVAKGKGWRSPGFIHSVVMDNLTLGRRYFFIYGDDTGGWSEESYFVASPISDPKQGVRLIAFGDMGKAEDDGSEEHWEEYPSLITVKNMIEKLDQTDLVLHIGDISYAVGYSAQWDRFFDQIQPVASRVPYMTCIGNHERDFPNSNGYYNGTDSGGECGVPYEHYLQMPTPSIDQRWYSFNYGNVHFILMSTEHNFQKGSAQHSWIERDLASVNRLKTPWIIFSGHRPMYIDSTNDTPPNGDQPVAALLRKSLEDLLMKYKVDLALWGHNHSYQRTCAVYNQTCTKGAPTHVVIGMAGMGLTHLLEPKKPSWIEYVNDQEYGYTQIQTNATTLQMSFFNNDGVLRDHFQLSK